MVVAIKVIVVALFSALAWLVGKYTAEYFRPYNRS